MISREEIAKNFRIIEQDGRYRIQEWKCGFFGCNWKLIKYFPGGDAFFNEIWEVGDWRWAKKRMKQLIDEKYDEIKKREIKFKKANCSWKVM